MEFDAIRGVSGFVGSNLKEDLLLKGRGVLTIDRNLNIGIGLNQDPEIDTVYYLASYGNLYNQTDRDLIYKVNAIQPKLLLEKVEHLSCHQFFYFSSSSVYGFHFRKIKETDSLDGKTDYAKAKIRGETIVKEFSKRLPITIIRPFSITGVGEQDIHLIPTLIRSFFKGEEIILDESPVHDFIDVSDVILALQAIKDHRSKDTSGWVTYNIGSGVQYTNLEVLKTLEQVVGKTIPYTKMTNLREYDTNAKWVADTSRLEGLGWKPQKSLPQIIEEMVAAYQNGNNRNKSNDIGGKLQE